MKLLQMERERRKWTRAELARRAGMNGVTVGQIENGRIAPYPVQLQKLGAVLGISPGELMAETNEGADGQTA